MATRQRPKGTFVRSPCDWDIDGLSIGGAAFQTGPNGPDVTIDLFNDAQGGEYLHVYRIWICNDAQGLYQANPFFGHGANFVTQGFPVNFSLGAPYGAIYQDTTPNFTNTNQVIPNVTPFGSYLFSGTDSESFSSFNPPGPIAVIPPGYSLRVRSWISSFFQLHGLVVTFYWRTVTASN